MERNKQEYDIRTNIVFEFNVVGKTACNALIKEITKSVQNLVDKKSTVSLVGISLKKPTAGFKFIIPTLQVEENRSQVIMEKEVKDDSVNEYPMTGEFMVAQSESSSDDQELDEEEEDVSDDKESN